MTRFTRKEGTQYNKIWAPQEVDPRVLYLFALTPLFMPFLTALALAICIAIGVALGAAVGGGGGSGAGGPGALIGAALGIAGGVALAHLIYFAVPLFSYLLVVMVYFLLSVYQEVTGKQPGVVVADRFVNLKNVAFVSMLSVGLFSLLIFYITKSWLGWFEQEYYRSLNGANQALSAYFAGIGEALDVIETQIDRFGLIAALASLVSAGWLFWTYFGINYSISKSLRYCIEIFITAFFLDSAFTLACYFLFDVRGMAHNDFFAVSNAVDSFLRELALAPVRAIFTVFADLSALFDAIVRMSSLISDAIYAIVEVCLRILLIEEGALYNAVMLFIKFTKFLRVDFIFFILASVLWAIRFRSKTAKSP